MKVVTLRREGRADPNNRPAIDIFFLVGLMITSFCGRSRQDRELEDAP